MTVATQRRIFGLTMLVIAALLGMRALFLRPLYTDGDLRTSLRASLESVAQERGWLLSDIDIDSVGADRVRLTYRAHVRGNDPRGCHLLDLRTSSLSPCPDE